MSTIEASITIDLPDGVDPQDYIQAIENIVRQASGKDTDLYVSEMDNPLTTSPIGPR